MSPTTSSPVADELVDERPAPPRARSRPSAVRHPTLTCTSTRAPGRVARQLADRAPAGRSSASTRRAARAAHLVALQPSHEMPGRGGCTGRERIGLVEQLLRTVLAELALTRRERGGDRVRPAPSSRPRRASRRRRGGPRDRAARGDACRARSRADRRPARRPNPRCSRQHRDRHLAAGHAVAAVREVRRPSPRCRRRSRRSRRRRHARARAAPRR